MIIEKYEMVSLPTLLINYVRIWHVCRFLAPISRAKEVSFEVVLTNLNSFTKVTIT